MIDFQQVKKLNDELNIHNCYTDISFSINKDLFPTKLIDNELKQSKFCSQEFYDYTTNVNKYLKISSHNDDITYHIFWKGKTQTKLYSFLKSFKQSLIIHKIFDLKKKMNIYIFCCPISRYLPNKGSIEPKHINGGFTSNQGRSIFILRLEEFSKVILHELLHHSYIDKGLNFNNDSICMLKKTFNISQDTMLIPQEAVIEFWATIFHCLFMSYDYNLSFKSLIEIEKHWSICQSQKIIKKQNNTYWKETTNCFVYIVFKTIFLINYEKMLNMSIPYNTYELTKFLLEHQKDIKYSNNKLKSTRKHNSLRMMYLSNF